MVLDIICKGRALHKAVFIFMINKIWVRGDQVAEHLIRLFKGDWIIVLKEVLSNVGD